MWRPGCPWKTSTWRGPGGILIRWLSHLTWTPLIWWSSRSTLSPSPMTELLRPSLRGVRSNKHSITTNKKDTATSSLSMSYSITSSVDYLTQQHPLIRKGDHLEQDLISSAERALHPFWADSHGLQFEGADFHPSCFRCLWTAVVGVDPGLILQETLKTSHSWKNFVLRSEAKVP